MIKVWRFVKGNQIRGRGLCFQPGAQKSQLKLWRTTFDFFFTVSFEMGVGTGRAGRAGRTPRGGGAKRSDNDRSKNHQFFNFIVGKKKNYRKIYHAKIIALKKINDFIALTSTYADKLHMDTRH